MLSRDAIKSFDCIMTGESSREYDFSNSSSDGILSYTARFFVTFMSHISSFLLFTFSIAPHEPLERTDPE